MTGSTLFSEPFTKTAESDTSCSPDNDIGIVETGLDCGPEGVDVRSNVLAATFDRDTESHEGRLSHTGFRGAHVDLELS